MIRQWLISILFPLRMRIRDFGDRRTREERARAAALRERAQACQSARPDLHVRVERDAVPAWLEIGADVRMLRRQAD